MNCIACTTMKLVKTLRIFYCITPPPLWERYHLASLPCNDYSTHQEKDHTKVVFSLCVNEKKGRF